MSVRLTILGSGSSGNATFIETDSTRILVDAGFSGRQITQRLATIGRTPADLDAIVLTHEHTDHTQGLKTICPKFQTPVYCNRLTREAVEPMLKAPADFRIFETGAAFSVGDIQVESFSIPHDAHDPVGFVLNIGTARVGFLTDLGHATTAVTTRVRGVDVLILEANYDFELLQNDLRRPWSLKQRIASRHGHLSNDDAAKVMESVVTAEMRNVYLCHLSRDCNTRELAERCVSKKLNEMGASHMKLDTATQAEPTRTLELV